MKLQLLTVAAAALMAAPTLHAQATPAPAQARHSQMGPRHGHYGNMMKELNLTADQQAKVKAIHAKYKSQMKASATTFKPDRDAMKAGRAQGDTAGMRAARAKLQGDMAPGRQVHDQEMNEVRGILTPAQQQKFDAARAKMKAHEGNERGWAGKRAPKPAA